MFAAGFERELGLSKAESVESESTRLAAVRRRVPCSLSCCNGNRSGFAGDARVAGSIQAQNHSWFQAAPGDVPILVEHQFGILACKRIRAGEARVTTHRMRWHTAIAQCSEWQTLFRPVRSV